MCDDICTENRQYRYCRISGCCILNEDAATILAFVLTGYYNGERGFIREKYLRYLFFAFYLLHLLSIYFLRMYFFGS